MKYDKSNPGEAAPPLVSIIIPTYNEAEVIQDTIEEVERALRKTGYSYEIIIVDDNSPDGTWRIVEKISIKNRKVRLVKREGKRGLASAVMDGIMVARGMYVVVMDADLQHPPDVIPKLIKKAIDDGSDVVVASRYAKGGGVQGWNWLRMLMSRGANLIARLLVRGAGLTSDPMSGFFLVRRDVVIKNKSKLNLKGFKILFEILSKIDNLKVSEVPYVFRPRRAGTSKLSTNIILDFIIQVIENSSLAKFAIVGAIGAFVNLGLMAILLSFGWVKELASLVGIEASIVSNFVLNEYWTFRARFRRGWLGRLMGYHASSIAAIVTTFTVMELMSELLGLNPLYGQALGILAGFALNYTLASRGVWRWRMKGDR